MHESWRGNDVLIVLERTHVHAANHAASFTVDCSACRTAGVDQRADCVHSGVLKHPRSQVALCDAHAPFLPSRNGPAASGCTPCVAGFSCPAGSINKWGYTGIAAAVTTAIGGSANLDSAAGLAISNDGLTLYLADCTNHNIRQFVLATGVSAGTLVGSGIANYCDGVGTMNCFNRPFGIAIDNAGNMFVAEEGNHVVRQVVIATRTVSLLAGNPGNSGNAVGQGR